MDSQNVPSRNLFSPNGNYNGMDSYEFEAEFSDCINWLELD